MEVGRAYVLDKTRYFALLSRNISEKNKVSLGFENWQKVGPE